MNAFVIDEEKFEGIEKLHLIQNVKLKIIQNINKLVIKRNTYI